jgi:AcrR family transcriptional regulator
MGGTGGAAGCTSSCTPDEREKKDCILVSAAKAFARLGFKKASVDEIARDAGVAKGTIYLACDSKEDLFYQALHRELRAWVGETAKLVDPRKPADELLATVAVAGIAYLDQHPLVRELLVGGTNRQLPAWADRFDELRALGRQNVVEILELGIRQGRFRKDLDVDEVATLLQDLNASTYVFHDHCGSDAVRSAALAKRAAAGLDLVLNGLRARHA